ncbi:MAG TPA: Ig-like domain-containing protein [Gemmatimonadaceae bacterium]|nr:Ig-like domain-containing protein [Gemmatimonadaceae bacterium]
MLAVCGDPIGPRHTANLAFAPALSADGVIAMQNAGLTIDNVHIVIRRADESLLIDTTITFPAGSNEVRLNVPVEIEGTSETFSAQIELRSGQQILFSGFQSLEARPGAITTPTDVDVTFVGPGSNAASVDVTPPTSALSQGGTAQLTATAFDDLDQPIQGAFFNWSSSAPSVATVSTNGLVTAGNTAGTATITARIPDGVAGTHTTTVTINATSLVVISGGGQSGAVQSALATPFVVEARASGGTPIPGVQVTFAGLSAGSSVAPTTATTAADGRASTSMTLGTVAGQQNFQATAPGMSGVSVSATATLGAGRVLTKFSGDAQSAVVSTALPNPLVVQFTDQFTNPVSGATVTWARVSGNGAVSAATSTTNASGRAQITYTNGAVAGPESISATAGGSSVTFTATATPVAAPGITVSLAGGQTFVGVTFNVQVLITLNTPAPAGGVVVTLASSDETRLAFSPPGPITIPQGQTQGTSNVIGVAAGAATLTATATGYTQGTLLVPVSLRLINLPLSVNVPFGANGSVPIQLAEPAPAGGVIVNVVSSNPSVVSVVTPTVTLAQGATLANATVSGVLPGPVTLTANATGFIGGSSTVTSLANLNIIETNVALNATFGNTFTVRLQSSGNAIAAPAGGLQVNLVAADPTCVSVPATTTIIAGLTDVVVSATYGGSATLPCNTTVTASATNIVSDNVALNVAPMPTITLSNSPVGVGLQRAQSISLSSSSPTGATVQLVSSDPAAILLSTDVNTLGSASINVPLGPGVSSATYYVQSVGSTGSVTVTPSAANMNGVATTQTIVTAWLDISGTSGAMTTLDPDNAFTVRVGVGSVSGLSELQNVRAGAPPLSISLSVADGAVMQLVTTSGVAASATTAIQPVQSSSPGSVASGGVALRPAGVGTTTVTATSTGASSTNNATRSTTISAPGISVSNSTTGAGLQRAQSVSLGASNHGGVTVRITSTDPARLLIAPNASTVGSAFIDVNVLNGNSFLSFVTQGIEAATGSVVVDVTTPLFTPGSATIPLAQPFIDISGVSTSVNVLGPDNAFTARVGIGSPAGLSELQNVRAGGAGYTIDITSSVPGVVGLVTSSGVSANATVSIPALASSSPGSVATGGVATTPLTVGTSTISATGAGLTPTTNASRTMTVTAATMTLSTSTIGSGLQRGGSGSLSGGDHGGITVRVTSANPSVMLVSPDANTPGSAFVDIAVPNGNTFFSYVVQGVEGQTGNITLTASSPLFTDATSQVTVQQPAIDISGVPASATTLGNDNAFTVRVGIGTAGGLSELQNIRAGGTTVTATVTSSTVAGQVLNLIGAGSSATASIAPLNASTPGSVATGGVAFRPFSAGSTVISATIPGFLSTTNASRTVNVTSPTMSMSPTTVGGGLMRGSSGSLSDGNHGGITVRVTSSNPAIALLAPNTTTAATAFIDIPVPNGQTFYSYTVHGVEGALATVQITAVAPGFTDGTTTATVVAPMLDISGVSTTRNTASTTDAFTVRIGIGNPSGLSELQNLRFGASQITATVTTTNATVVPLVTLAGNVSSTTVTIAAGNSSSPGSVATGGVAVDGLIPGTATISATIPTYTATTNASRTVTVTQASMSVSAQTVGAGLQRAGSISLSGSDHGGITVRLTSADPSRVLVAPNATTAGSAFIDLVITNGNTFAGFVAQAIEGTTGDVLVTATTPTFTSGSELTSVVQPALDVSGLVTTLTAGGADDAFTIRVGVPNSNFTGLTELQNIRFGASPATVTVTSTNAAIATLVTTPLTAGTVTLSIAPQNSSTPGSVATGGVAIRPLTVGSLTVSATIAGYRILPTSSIAVVVQ